MHHGKDQGYTLIEAMIGLALSSIAIIAVQSFLSGVAVNQAKSSDKIAATQTNRTLLDILQRDLKYAVQSTITDRGESIRITRKALYTRGRSDQNYTVTFRSQCQKIKYIGDEGARLRLKTAYSTIDPRIYRKTPNRCLDEIDCRADEFPQVTISVNGRGDSIPTYPLAEFPKTDADWKNQSIGTGLCFDSIGNKIRIVVESLYFTDRTQTAIAIISQDLILPSRNDSTVELLPTSNY